jgi:nucleotidyltransferase substrate binding protein (TIGR01987 family)
MEEINQSFQESVGRLREVLAVPESTIVRDSAIKRFELTVELAWKSVQKYLREQDIECNSPRRCFQEAYKLGVVSDSEEWHHMFLDRNLAVHTYDEKFAEGLYQKLPMYFSVLGELAETLASNNDTK